MPGCLARECGCVLIKARPYTGKTSQLHLLMQWLTTRNYCVAYVTFLTLRPEDNVLNFIARHVHCSWKTLQQVQLSWCADISIWKQHYHAFFDAVTAACCLVSRQFNQPCWATVPWEL